MIDAIICPIVRRFARDGATQHATTIAALQQLQRALKTLAIPTLQHHALAAALAFAELRFHPDPELNFARKSIIRHAEFLASSQTKWRDEDAGLALFASLAALNYA